MLSSNTSAVSGDANYIEDVFSTYLYTGTGSSRSLVNGIDLATKGGMIWSATRSGTDVNGPEIIDTVRGGDKRSLTPGTGAEYTLSDPVTFNADGITVSSTANSFINYNGNSKVLWTFREQPKFFDVVTYTGTGSNRTVAHNLGSTPGVIIIKQTSASGRGWITYHRSIGPTGYLDLSQTNATDTWSIVWNNTAPTSTEFTVGTFAGVNESGATYVAYIFAHDAGGFGLTGTDNVISCGSWSGNGSTQDINLGYEPQYILLKNVTLGYNWVVSDTMRGMNNTDSNWVYANTTAAEATNTPSYLIPTATGFKVNTATPTYNASGSTYIYIAIRRGPMKVPTDGTKVFAVDAPSSSQTGYYAGFPVDAGINTTRVNATNYRRLVSRLTGTGELITQLTNAEGSSASYTWDSMSRFMPAASIVANQLGYSFRRAPSFFDEVCYTGTGSATTFSHNLGVAPELMIVKCRGTPTSSGDWDVYSAASGPTKVQFLNTTDEAVTQSTHWNNTAPTASVFTVGTNARVNESGLNYVAYLFATCAGVSKCGSYTGTGTTKQVDCGFAAGARFVLIKRTDSTGDWYVWDTARGIVSGNDPYLLLNSTAAEVTSTDYIDTYSAGFELSSTAPAALNASGGTYIFLAIA